VRIEVLRIGHRPDRDKRITTHVALVARAFGASAIFIDTPDKKLEETVDKVKEQFGGDFRIVTGVSHRKALRSWKGTVVHLTMYGIPLDEAIIDIPQGEDILVVVGSEKVPREVYDLAHLNVSVTSQPHSEVFVLAMFLDRVRRGAELSDVFPGGKVAIEPSRRGKSFKGGPMEGPVRRNPPIFGPVPTAQECKAILEDLGCPGPVLLHVEQVHSMGMDMVRAGLSSDPDLGKRLDIPLVEAGLLLHDIGRTRTHSIRHVTLGAAMAMQLGLDRKLVDIIHGHVGAGLTSDEAVPLGLPPDDYMPRTFEEKLVCHADNLIGRGRRITLEEAVSDLRSKGAFAGAARMEEMHSELERFLGIDIDSLIPRPAPGE